MRKKIVLAIMLLTLGVISACNIYVYKTPKVMWCMLMLYLALRCIWGVGRLHFKEKNRDDTM